MRLELSGKLEVLDILFDEDSEGAWEPDDRGCETQSSDSESSQACSMVYLLLNRRKSCSHMQSGVSDCCLLTFETCFSAPVSSSGRK